MHGHEALYGAWLAGACLGNVGMALHHKLCHTLGGSITCRMRKRTRSFFRTRYITTAMLRPKRWCA
jgi:hypothetical protein